MVKRFFMVVQGYENSFAFPSMFERFDYDTKGLKFPRWQGAYQEMESREMIIKMANPSRNNNMLTLIMIKDIK